MSFDWKNLSRERRQVLLLGSALGTVAALGLAAFLFRQSAMLRQTRAELIQTREQVERAETAIRAEAERETERTDLQRALGDIFGGQLPPPRNTLSWATRTFHAAARAADVRLDNIIEINILAPWLVEKSKKKTALAEKTADGGVADGKPAAKKPVAKKPAGPAAPERRFGIYAAQVTFTAGYDATLRFVRQLAEDQPYAVIASLAIAGQAQHPERHAVALTVHWPWPDVTLEQEVP